MAGGGVRLVAQRVDLQDQGPAAKKTFQSAVGPMLRAQSAAEL
jgi:hypothetical protein